MLLGNKIKNYKKHHISIKSTHFFKKRPLSTLGFLSIKDTKSSFKTKSSLSIFPFVNISIFSFSALLPFCPFSLTIALMRRFALLLAGA